MSQAVRKAATVLHTNRRRCRLISLSSGPTEATPAPATALEVPTAGVPTYLVASPVRATEAAAEAVTVAAAAGRGTEAAVVAAGATAAAAAGATAGAAGSPSRAVIS